MTTTEKGKAYILARAKGDGRVRAALEDIGRHGATGNADQADVARVALDQLIYQRHDDQPMYGIDDVTAAAREAFARKVAGE